MCGICGFYDKKDDNLLKRMSDSLIHRGPDEGGFFSDENCSLASRRLSIIDMETGSQPYFSNDKSIVCVFNGEIYNFKVLRQELEKKGFIFKSRSDGEVIVHLYKEYKDKMFSRLRGMFAFALYDIRENKLILARDHLGIKPLFYLTVKDRIYFASEIKALKCCPALERKIDALYAANFFAFGYSPGENSIYEKIKKLPPASYMEFSGEKIEIKKYWSFPSTRDVKIDDEFIEETRDIIREAVKEELVSDAPLGIFLSGGMDSSSLAYFASKEKNGKVKTFTASFREGGYDESFQAAAAASALGLENRAIEITSSPEKVISFLSNHMDQPFSDSSIIANYLVSKEARRYVKTAISGLGGDEVFGGYPRYAGFILSEYLSFLPVSFFRFARRLASLVPDNDSSSNWPQRIKRFFSGLSCKNAYEQWLYQNGFKYIDFSLKEAVPSLIGLPERENLSEFEFRNYLEGDLLYLADTSSMAASLELRVPLLDIRLVEKIASLPIKTRMPLLRKKHILKKAMKNLLPEHCFKGKKGFQVPFSLWFSGDFKDMAFDLISSSDNSFYDRSAALKVLKRHLNKEENNADILYSICVWELWLKNERK